MKKTFLILAAGIAATVAGFSQATTRAPVPAPIAATTGKTLPVTRTLTSADGRTIDVTILSKSATAIKAARADGKEFEIALDKLSDADKAFVAGLITPPVKELTAYLTGESEIIRGKLEAAGFKVTSGGKSEESQKALTKMTDQDLKKFDLIWVSTFTKSWRHLGAPDRPLELLAGAERKERGDKLLRVMRRGTLTAWESSWKTPIRKFIENSGGVQKGSGYGANSDKAYIETEDNIIFFNWTVQKWDSKDGSTPTVSTHPEILDQVIIQAKNLIKNPVNLADLKYNDFSRDR